MAREAVSFGLSENRYIVGIPPQHLLQWLFPEVLVDFVGLDLLLVSADSDE